MSKSAACSSPQRADERSSSNMLVVDIVSQVAPNDPPSISSKTDPLRMIFSDLLILVQNFALLPKLFTFRDCPDITKRGFKLQIILQLLSIPLLLSFIFSFGFLLRVPIYAMMMIDVFELVIGWCSDGRQIEGEGLSGNDDEIILFINGIGKPRESVTMMMTELNRILQHPIIGLHNRSYGVFTDLLFCLIQRDLKLDTIMVRETYKFICGRLMKDEVKKIMVISHSQGQIISQIVATQLLSTFSNAILQKVSWYSFGGAANSFPVPFTGNGRIWGDVEYFVNDGDLIGKLGVLSAIPKEKLKLIEHADQVPKLLGNHCGRIFIRQNTPGHLLLSHYLAPEKSILDEYQVKQHSGLVKYINRHQTTSQESTTGNVDRKGKRKAD